MSGNLVPFHDRTKHAVYINKNIKYFTEDGIERITNNYSTPIEKGGFGEETSMTYILHNSNTSIPFDVRLGIAIGCAEALIYMHSMHLSGDSLVCHGDIKPAKILLDANLTAKVSDFGLSRLLLGGITQYTRNVKGSNIKILEEIGKLATDYLTLDIHKRPRITDVAKRLLMLWRQENRELFFRTENVGTSNLMRCLGSFEMDVVNSEILVKLGNMRFFTQKELTEFTRNFSCLLREDLVILYNKAYDSDNSGAAMFGKDITAAEDVILLEDNGKLAIECTKLGPDLRPTMKEVAERLEILRISWGKANQGR
ncbi:hypothetical protein ZWY2020_046744 [Hordeum vulgare]|nr:hypothetical protein ZWY2020_046744 [Hordeum vulgare]